MFKNILLYILLFLAPHVLIAQESGLNNSQQEKKALPYEDYIQVRGGINQFFYKTGHNKNVTVAFLGGSITYNPGWRQKVCNYLKERFPKTNFHFIAAGIPSLGSLPHAFRLQRDVLDSGNVDLLFVEAAVNDRVNGTDSLTQVRGLEGIVRHARKSNPLIDIVMLEFADPYKNKDYDKGITPVEIINHELVADHYHLPSVNLAKEVYDKLKNKEFSWEKDFKDLHPAPFGQELYFENIKKLLETTAISPKASPLPEPLDDANFSAGSYYNIHNAKYDQSWVLDENWSPSDHVGTRKGFVNVPVLSSIKSGAKLSLSFRGTAVGIAILAGPDAGSITYSIDNMPAKHVNLYTEWSNMLHLPWYVLLGSDLKKGSHTLTIITDEAKTDNSKGGNACRIVYFFKND